MPRFVVNVGAAAAGTWRTRSVPFPAKRRRVASQRLSELLALLLAAALLPGQLKGSLNVAEAFITRKVNHARKVAGTADTVTRRTYLRCVATGTDCDSHAIGIERNVTIP